MDNHNFCYNYGFLADWIKVNPEVKKYGILRELEMSDYRTLQNWMEGLTMMPLTQMMKFCNRYNVPITAFFFDENADEDSAFSPIHNGAQIEPSGGWKESDRRAGIKSGDPRTNLHFISKLPEYVKPCRISPKSETKSCTKTTGTGEETMLPAKERMRYLDLIEKLNGQVLDLAHEIISLKEENMRLRLKNDTPSYGMVPEPPTAR